MNHELSTINHQTFYIFRHGETFASKNGTGYGDQVFTAPILEEGIPIIEAMGEYLKKIKTDYNVSSEIERCRQTVTIISRITGKEFIFDERLNEPFMESFQNISDRLTSLLDDIKKNKYHSILICTHGAIIGTLLGFFTKQQFAEENLYNYPPPGVLTIVKGTFIKQLNFNKF